MKRGEWLVDIIKVYQPKNYKSFTCNGSTCKVNCCRYGWQIQIDKKTYDKYADLDEEIKNDLYKNIRVISEDPFNAVMITDANGDCSYLNDNKLCSIQLRFGFEYLSNVCKSYPRTAYYIGGSVERYLELSCETAAKLILLDKSFMDFEEIELEYSTLESEGLAFQSLDIEKYTKSTHGNDIFWKLRVASVAILQSRQYKIRFRMLILCMFIQEAAELIAAGQDFNIIALSDTYMDRLDNNYYIDLYAELPNGTERELNVTLDILNDMLKNKIHLKPILEQVMTSFGLDAENPDIPDDFEKNYSVYYEQYFADKEYIFENYLVHRVLSEGFPFNYRASSDVLSNYVDLLAKYNLVEFIFTGICRHHMKFDKRFIINCIAHFTRSYEHSQRKYLKAE